MRTWLSSSLSLSNSLIGMNQVSLLNCNNRITVERRQSSGRHERAEEQSGENGNHKREIRMTKSARERQNTSSRSVAFSFSPSSFSFLLFVILVPVIVVVSLSLSSLCGKRLERRDINTNPRWDDECPDKVQVVCCFVVLFVDVNARISRISFSLLLMLSLVRTANKRDDSSSMFPGEFCRVVEHNLSFYLVLSSFSSQLFAYPIESFEMDWKDSKGENEKRSKGESNRIVNREGRKEDRELK